MLGSNIVKTLETGLQIPSRLRLALDIVIIGKNTTAFFSDNSEKIAATFDINTAVTHNLF